TNTTTGVGYHYWNGASWVRLSTGDAWELTGNAGTNAATNFLGTTDNIDFSIRRSNLERFRLNATSVVFNENSYNYDFRIESNNQANIFFIDAGSDEIGIRTNAPTSMLHMTNGGINVGANAMAAYDNLGADGVAISGYNQGTGNGYNGIEGITAGTYSGVMGLGITQGAGGDGVLGSTNDWQSIGVVGTRFNSGGANTGFGGLFVNDLGYTGWFGNVSDKRLKKDITKINNALSILTQLNPVKYYFDIEKYPNMGLNTELEYGFIAQEVNDILPEIIREKLFPTNGASETKLNTPKENQEELFFAMDYTRLIPIAIQAIKEQQTIIEAQNTKIEALEKIVLELQKAIETK
ncbi:MAG: tail fiber domain-containing protein, partial [Flavobacteriales bacterium]|nr:tail fiber domain-containing protein [Flavobacteriales bacterium]